MIDLTEWANGSHNSFGDAIYMAALTTALVLAVGVVVWRLGKRLILHATHRIPRDAQPLLEDTKFVICLALVGGFGLLLTVTFSPASTGGGECHQGKRRKQPNPIRKHMREENGDSS